jgi:hypothetical protein
MDRSRLAIEIVPVIAGAVGEGILELLPVDPDAPPVAHRS